MALSPQNNEAFFREVDEELRRDQAASFFRRYGRLLIAALVLFLLAVGGLLWWRAERERQGGLEAEALVRAQQALDGPAGGRPAAVAELERLRGSSRDGYAASARLTLADAAMQRGDVKAAVAGYAAIADDTGLPQPFRDLAQVRRTAAEFDSLEPGTVMARLQGLAVAGQPWFGSAGEMVAVARLRQGDRAGAGRLFAALARDGEVPPTIRSRAVQMAGLLGVDAVSAGVVEGGTKQP